MAGNERERDERRHQDARLELSHLRRESRTALELAVVALAPWRVVERLATSAGLLEALGELPPESPPVLALVPKMLTVAKSALDEWQQWQKDHLEQRLARG